MGKKALKKTTTAKSVSGKKARATKVRAKSAIKSPAVTKPSPAITSAGFIGFSPALLHFLTELADNNNREWFEANKPRYEQVVREPALAFIGAMAPRLAKLSKHLVASDKVVGGSMMRIHRDVRFSKEKSPYKTNLGIQFRHACGKDVHAPGLYFHIDSEGVFLGAGLWHPEAQALLAIRQYIVSHGPAWQRVRDDETFTKHWQLAGESLSRPPRGFASDHPFVEDLQRKDHFAVSKLKFADISRADFADLVALRYGETKSYLALLCKALGESF